MFDSPITAAAEADISAALLAAPAWAQIALTTRSEALRERGAGELARSIVEALSAAEAEDSDQLALPL